jgi:hypothetical protein
MTDSIESRDSATMEAIDGLVTGQLTRQDFMKRAALLGFSASAVGSMLAAAGKASAADSPPKAMTSGSRTRSARSRSGSAST